MNNRSFRFLACLLLLGLTPGLRHEAAPQAKKAAPPPVPGPMLEQGMIELSTPDFDLSLVRSSQTIAALKPKGGNGFDFTPGDLLVERSQSGYYHLGDLNLRVRQGNASEWKGYSTAVARIPVTALPALCSTAVMRGSLTI